MDAESRPRCLGVDPNRFRPPSLGSRGPICLDPCPWQSGVRHRPRQLKACPLRPRPRQCLACGHGYFITEPGYQQTTAGKLGDLPRTVSASDCRSSMPSSPPTMHGSPSTRSDANTLVRRLCPMHETRSPAFSTGAGQQSEPTTRELRDIRYDALPPQPRSRTGPVMIESRFVLLEPGTSAIIHTQCNFFSKEVRVSPRALRASSSQRRHRFLEFDPRSAAPPAARSL